MQRKQGKRSISLCRLCFFYVDLGTAHNPPPLLRLTTSSVCKDCHQPAIIDKVSELKPNDDVCGKTTPKNNDCYCCYEDRRRDIDGVIYWSHQGAVRPAETCVSSLIEELQGKLVESTMVVDESYELTDRSHTLLEKPKNLWSKT